MSNYEKKYKEALGKAKDMLSYKEVRREDMEYLFPELKESKDEKIRACIEMCLTDIDEQRFADFSTNLKECLAWLEKQGEHKPAFDIDIPFGAKDSELIAESYYIPKGFHAEIDKDKVVIKKGEKPTAWSEYDKERIKNILSVLDVQVCWDGATMEKRNPYQKEIDWLKSLRPQNTWKPSDEQIKAFEHFVKSIGESGYSSPYDNNTKLLYSLLEQLKKLRGE